MADWNSWTTKLFKRAVDNYQQPSKAQGETAARLIDSLRDIPNAAIRVGTVLLLKVTGDAGPGVILFDLSEAELKLLGDNPTLFQRPRELLAELERHRSAIVSRSGERHDQDAARS